MVWFALCKPRGTKSVCGPSLWVHLADLFSGLRAGQEMVFLLHHPHGVLSFRDLYVHGITAHNPAPANLSISGKNMVLSLTLKFCISPTTTTRLLFQGASLSFCVWWDIDKELLQLKVAVKYPLQRFHC